MQEKIQRLKKAAASYSLMVPELALAASVVEELAARVGGLEAKAERADAERQLGRELLETFASIDPRGSSLRELLETLRPMLGRLEELHELPSGVVLLAVERIVGPLEELGS